MNHLKIKLSVSVLLLLLAFAMLAASTFAWFTISANPEVTGLSATIAANENLEIAFAKTDAEGNVIATAPSAVGDSGNYYTWGNLVSFDSAGTLKTAFDAFMETLDALMPVTLVGKKFVIPDYDTIGNGRPDVDEDGNPISTTLDELQEDPGYGMGTVYRTVSDSGTGETKSVYAFFLDFWLRTNVEPAAGEEDIPIVLSAADQRSSGGAMGKGCYFLINIPPGDEEESGDAGEEEETDYTETCKILAQNMRVAFLDVTPSDLGDGIDPATADAALVPIEISTPTVSGDQVTAKFDTDTELIRLKKNQAKLIRMYVYLDGMELENPDAGIPLVNFDATVNVQFAVQGREIHSMDEGSGTEPTAP